MEIRKTDMDGARFSLKEILAAFGLIMEDIEQEHQDTKCFSFLLTWIFSNGMLISIL